MPANYQPPRLSIPVRAEDHSEGPVDAPIVLVEFGDYQCPHCGAAYPVVQKVQKKLGSELRFVFRNFPLTYAHPQALWAAETVEAAGAQGKYWEMHDFVFEHQPSLGQPTIFLDEAKRWGLDAKRIEKEVAAHVHLARIQEDYSGGIRSGVNGTPTFFIQGVRYDGPPDVTPLVAALKSSAKPTRRK
ncbi:MAG: DsbA family protein [Thermoplasmata archaeon]|nr:DsbA family protein [Thermoplasmata archaeon]